MRISKLDKIDRKILSELQSDGRMTNVDLAKKVGISAPPCLRRVRSLEEGGYIKGYHAIIENSALGFQVKVFAMVGLVSQAESDLSAFEEKCDDWPLVRECHMLNGEVDFILTLSALPVPPVVPTLSSNQIGSLPTAPAYTAPAIAGATEELTAAENVASVKTSLVIRGSKEETGVPFEVVEERIQRLL